jgi:hypothetical protein
MLRWICGHTRSDIKQRPVVAPVRSEVIRQTDKGKRGRERSNMTWEKSVKRDLKD